MRRPLPVLLTLVLLAAPAGASVREQTGQWSVPFWEGDAYGIPYDPPSYEKSAMYPSAVHMVVLPDGRVLYWNGFEGIENGGGPLEYYFQGHNENARARLLDLSGPAPAWSKPDPERGRTDQATPQLSDLWCSDQKLLYDGTVLIAGGQEFHNDIYGDNQTTTFDPATNSFSEAGLMSNLRWYPSLVTLADGRVLVASGSENLIVPKPDPAFNQVRESEIYDPAARSWTPAGATPFSLPQYPRLHLLPSGKVLYTATGITWGVFGEAPDEATWGLQQLYDPATQSWSIAGASQYGVRGNAMSVMLRLEPPYEGARILIAGGTLAPAPGGLVATTLSEIVTADGDEVRNESVPKAPFAGLAGDPTQLRHGRWFSSPVLLPTGEVLAFNGADMDGVLAPSVEAAVRTTELYDPVTNTWTNLSAGARDRTYHNSAALLPDGRVLVGGHATDARFRGYENPLHRRSNTRDSTFEIFSPPYLFRSDPAHPRPEITGLDAVGGTLRIAASPDVSEVVLVRTPATTHIIDADMRAVNLTVRTAADGRLEASLPGRSIVPPGPYYVFALRDTSEGPVPSVARTVLVRPDGTIAPVLGP